jgi:hypothetical protein
MTEDREDATTERPADGPSRGEPGPDEGKLGEKTSQGKPGSGVADPGSGSDRATRPDLEAPSPRDTKEGADSKVSVVEPGGEDPSPRA